MNFQQLNVFSVFLNTTLLTALASFLTPALAAHPEHNPAISQHDHYSISGTTMPMPLASMQTVPDVDKVADTEHSKSAPQSALSRKNQISDGLRNPDYSDGYQNAASHHMMSSPNFWSLDAEKLELAHDDLHQQTSGQYELKLWYGNDYHRLYLNTSGEITSDDLEQASTSMMWWRPFSTYWNTTLGFKQDYLADSADQTWLGGGIHGLAPYWFDIEANLYGTTKGNSQLEFNASYDLNISQKWVLQPEIELLAYGKTSIEHRYGAGLAEIKTGLRLRYEITPQFAPYLGFERERFVGKTARIYQNLEANTGSSKIILGLRFWY